MGFNLPDFLSMRKLPYLPYPFLLSPRIVACRTIVRPSFSVMPLLELELELTGDSRMTLAAVYGKRRA